MDDPEIRILLSRLARPHSSGGQVIERAAILAEGAQFPVILAWITAHDGAPEAMVAPRNSASGGLHSSRMHDNVGAEPRVPQRYVLPAGALASAST
jgi:hypothetical protein